MEFLKPFYKKVLSGFKKKLGEAGIRTTMQGFIPIDNITKKMCSLSVKESEHILYLFDFHFRFRPKRTAAQKRREFWRINRSSRSRRRTMVRQYERNAKKMKFSLMEKSAGFQQIKHMSYKKMCSLSVEESEHFSCLFNFHFRFRPKRTAFFT